MSKPLDFTKVESLRQHMLLRKEDMASLLGVSRVTYYAWVGGKPLRKSNEANTRAVLKKLLAVVTEHGWPTPTIRSMQQKHRLTALNELLSAYEQGE